MSAQNRTALKAIITAWEAVLDLETDDKPAMQHILDSVVLNRDVSTEITVAGTGTTNVDFAEHDTIKVATGFNCTLNIQNIQDGDVKFLHVTKNVDIEVLFTGATDMTVDPEYTRTKIVNIVYLVTRKSHTVIQLVPLTIAQPKRKRIYFTWDMKTNTTKNFNHGITDWQSINIEGAMFWKDGTPTVSNRLATIPNLLADNFIRVTATEIQLGGTILAGVQDDYQLTTDDRGFVEITYY